MKKKQLGFTLIELIVVIIILGILAAFALPRFANLDKEARRAVTEGLGGSIRASAALAHGKFLGAQLPAGSSIVMEGKTIFMVNGYPRNGSIANTIVDISGFTENTGTSGGASIIRWVPNTISDGYSNTCYVEYSEATKGNVPIINVETSDCT